MAAERAPPPTRMIRLISMPWSRIRSAQYWREHSKPSTPARAMLALFRFRPVMPCRAPLVRGRLGERSPSKYGTSDSPSAPAGADRARSDNVSKSTSSILATAASTGAPFRVHTKGKCRPVASAKPATSPAWSAGALSLTALTTPEVPSDTMQSPGTAPSASAAAALSPAPAPMPAPDRMAPPFCAGPTIRGTIGARPLIANSSKRGWYSSAAALK